MTLWLEEDFDYIAILIEGPPVILPLAFDSRPHFVQEPCIAEILRQ